MCIGIPLVKKWYTALLNNEQLKKKAGQNKVILLPMEEQVFFFLEICAEFTCFTGTKVQILTSEEEICTRFTCFTGTPVQILTYYGGGAASARGSTGDLYSVYLLYWYKSTNPDTEEEQLLLEDPKEICTQFTCFTGTKVQILTLKRNSFCSRIQRTYRATMKKSS
jgi:hypothetical protein